MDDGCAELLCNARESESRREATRLMSGFVLQKDTNNSMVGTVMRVSKKMED